MERLFLIGGSGFIGIDVMECLLKAGVRVYNYDCCNMADYVETYLRQLGNDYHLIQGDTLDGEKLRLSLRGSGANTVIHMAVVTVTKDREKNDTWHIFDANCKDALNVLDASVTAGTRRFLYVSSITAYGTTAYKADILIEEMENLNPGNPYRIFKFTSRKLALRYQYLYHMDIACARLGDVFGPWEKSTRFRDKVSTPCITLKYAMDGIQVVLKRPNRTSWVYSRDTAGALFWLAGRSPEWDVYSLSSGGTQSTVNWYQALCPHYPGFKQRLVGREEESNVFYHGIRDNALMSVPGLYESGYAPQCNMEKAIKGCTAWVEECPQMFRRVK